MQILRTRTMEEVAELELSPASVAFGADGSGSVTVSVISNVTWDVAATTAWGTGTGSINIVKGSGAITISSSANNLYESRSQQITVSTTDGSGITRILTVTQAAKGLVDITSAVVTAASQTYNGSAKTPTPTVTLNGSTVPSSGYDVTYGNNTNAGNATITVTGKGDYTGTATGTFTIAKASRTVSFSSPTTSVDAGSTVTNTASVSTGASDGTLAYSSSNTSVATVSNSGVVTGISAGSVTITATISEGTNYLSASASYSISVINQPVVVTDGVYIETTDGNYITSSNWSSQGSGKTANAIAIINGDWKRRIYIDDSYSLGRCLLSSFDPSACTSETDGEINTAILRSLGSRPAFAAATFTVGGSTYLPARQELTDIFTYLTQINACRTALGKSALPTGNYWSSTYRNYDTRHYMYVVNTDGTNTKGAGYSNDAYYIKVGKI